MMTLILSLLIASQTPTPAGEDMLNKMAQRYSNAPGIQWTMQSRTYSQIFEQTTTTPMQFNFNPPDTFYYKSGTEEVIGISDTVWILSKANKQIQKKLTESYLMPTNFIIRWSERYDLKGYSTKGDQSVFELQGKENVTPADVKLTLDNNSRLKQIFYKDVSGDDVTLSVTKEKLRKAKSPNLFYKHIPQGYKLIDLTE